MQKSAILFSIITLLSTSISVVGQTFFHQEDFYTVDPDTVTRLTVKGVRDIPAEIGRYKNLQYLHIQKFRNTEFELHLPPEISNCKNLEEIYIDGYTLSAIPQIENLETISFDLIGSYFIPDGLFDLTSLTYVGLLTDTIPPEISNLKNLTGLSIRGPYHTVPVDLYELHNLRHVWLAGYFEELPPGIHELDSLKRLKIQSKNLLSVQEDILRIAGLEKLWIYEGNFEEFPSNFHGESRLRDLKIIGSHLSIFPLGLEKLRFLDTLALNRNRLSTVPSSIPPIQSLSHLSLVDNQLREVPFFIFESDSLEVLLLNGNQIETIPEGLSRLQKLWAMNLGDNEFVELPEDFVLLPQNLWMGLDEEKIREEHAENLMSKRPDIRVVGNSFFLKYIFLH